MKLIRLLAAAAMALTATTAMAQGGPPGGGQGGGQRMMDMMMKDITLSDVQKAKIDSIVAGARAESTKLREGMEPGSQMTPELREKSMAITAKRNEAIKAVLTPDQQAIFAKNLEAMPTGRPRPPR